MLSISTISNAQGAVDYYNCLATRNDYYLESGEPPGEWHGAGAATLGLTGQIEVEEFRAVLEGRDPVTGAGRVWGAGSDRHRPGWDLTFSAPKSVSALWAVAGKVDRAAIQDAHDQAVQAALAVLESEAATARRGRGGCQRERTAGLVVACYQHATSRAMEPQLHTHALTANMAPRADGSWGALEAKPVYEWKMAAGAAYRAEFAAGVQQLGYNIEADACDSFRITGVPQSLCRRWSTRTEAIQSTARKHGVTTAKGKEVAALASRQGKAAVDRPALFAHWQSEAAEAGFTTKQIAELRSAQIGQKKGEELSVVTDEQILADMTERRSVFRRADVFRACAVAEQTRGSGVDAVYERAEQMLQSHEVIRLRAPDGSHRYTTREMLRIEAGIRDTALVRNAEQRYVCPRDAVRTVAATKTLSDEQVDALAYLTRHSGGVAAIVGDAGTGKSYLMGAAREVWQDSGFRVHGCALAGKAADGLKSGAGIESQTLHSLLYALDNGREKLTRQDVIVLDEAGMIGARQMAALVEYTNTAGAKLVVVGDNKQLQPIEAGASFRHVAEAAGAARLAEIRRQKHESDRAIVHDFARGNAVDALAALAMRGQFHTADTAGAAFAGLVDAWAAQRDPAQPGESLMIAGTRRDVAVLNQVGRDAVRNAGLLPGGDHVVRMGEDGALTLAEGERVLFTRNSRLYGVKNGQLGTAQEIRLRQDGAAVVVVKRDDGGYVTIDTAEYKHVQHGYAVTAHKAQGVTVNHAHVYASDSMSDREWSYVAASRARYSTAIYADRATGAELGRLMSRSRQAESALDYVHDDMAELE